MKRKLKTGSHVSKPLENQQVPTENSSRLHEQCIRVYTCKYFQTGKFKDNLPQMAQMGFFCHVWMFLVRTSGESQLYDYTIRSEETIWLSGKPPTFGRNQHSQRHSGLHLVFLL